MTKERLVECFCVVGILGGQLLQHVGVAADGALTKDHQVAGHDVGPFHGDRDGVGAIADAQVVAWAEGHGLAAVNVHGIAEQHALELGQLTFQNGRGDGGLFAVVDQVGGLVYRGGRDVGQRGHASQRLLYAFHFGNRHVELTTYPCKAAAPAQRIAGGTGGARRQRDAAANRQALHQHPPALTDHVRAADDGVQRYENVLALDRAIHEGAADGVVAAANLHALCVTRDQGQRNATVFFVAQQLFRVEQAECQAHHSGNRRQGDPAFLEIEAHPDHFLAIDDLLADHAGIRQRGGVGACAGAGQAKTGDFTAIGQARQIVILLCLGAVLEQQLTGAQGVGDTDGHHQRFVGGKLLQYHGLRLGREAQTTVLLRDDHAEEAFLLQVIPQFLGQVGTLLGDVPGVAHACRLGALHIQKGLLFFAQPVILEIQQRLPLGLAGKQLSIPGDAARFQRGALGGRHLGGHFLEGGKDAWGQPEATQGGQTGHGHGQCADQQQGARYGGAQHDADQAQYAQQGQGRRCACLAAHHHQQASHGQHDE